MKRDMKRRPEPRKARKAWKRRRDGRLEKVWDQPKPGSWFDRLIGRKAKGRKS